MSLYADYVKERTGRSVIENDDGFVVYYDLGSDSVFIEDMFVSKDKRRSKIGSSMADLIVKDAISRGKKMILCSVDPRANNSTDSIKIIMAYGFKLYCTNGPMILLKLDLGAPNG